MSRIKKQNEKKRKQFMKLRKRASLKVHKALNIRRLQNEEVPSGETQD